MAEDSNEADDERSAPETMQEIVGCRVLVGITTLEHDGTFAEQKQFHGCVASADENGILLMLEGKRAGENYRLPPDLTSFRRARAGSYTLRSTGEVIIDPDFVTTWTVTRPPQKH